MTHCEQILDHIREHGSITQQDAYHFKPHGCTRLASRVHDLKVMGYPIAKVMETKKYDDGATISYARYYLEDTNNDESSAS